MTSTVGVTAGPAAQWPDDLFNGEVDAAELESIDGRIIAVDCRRWLGPLERADRLVLSHCRGPVLDVGCGPGRHVAALVASKVLSLGIDASFAAVTAARRRGAPAVHTSVFGPVPDPGRWRTALLLDGNVGIGGDVTRLLQRIRGLLAPGGQVLVETVSPLAPSGQAIVRVRHGGRTGAWFRWAWTTPADLHRSAKQVGMVVGDVFTVEGRWFAQLHIRPTVEAGA